jgi:hypothetical protein
MPKIYYQTETEKYLFQCPGCECLHFIDKTWNFNNDFEKPTVSPSIRVKGGSKGNNFICHFFVKDGQIQFLQDSSHHLAGQTVEIPEWNGI